MIEQHGESFTQFEFSPPRHFLLPAVLLLLVEEPSYGYKLVKGLRALQFGSVDRPAVYRALAQLERDGLVVSCSAESKTGQARRVYKLTADGELALRCWMDVVREQRDGLDRVLRRYASVDLGDCDARGAAEGVTDTPIVASFPQPYVPPVVQSSRNW